MSVAYQDANLRAPYVDNTNPSSVALYDVTTTNQATRLPVNMVPQTGRVDPNFWAGKMIYVTALTGSFWFAFSKDPNAVVDPSQAASAAGNNSKTVGKKIAANATIKVRVPSCRDDEALYFVRKIDTGSGVAELWLASD